MRRRDRIIEKETKNTIESSLKFTQHLAQFAKLISFIFIVIYTITWSVYVLISVHSYIRTGIFLMDVKEFVLNPVMCVLSFYYGTKVFENISKGMCEVYLKKVTNKPMDGSIINSDESYDDYGLFEYDDGR